MIRALLWATPTLLLAACGTSEQKCFEDNACAAGFRCELPALRGNSGVCKPCDAAEVPYDGVDNDCNVRTKDSDLDGDEDNAKTAAIEPGGDCDDQDPSVSSKELEICGDQKDNNCDGRVDERECGDRQPPSIQLISPTEGSTVSGVVRVEASAQDDIGVARVEFFVSGGAVLATDDSPPFEANIDTRTLTDGPLDLSARAVDLLGKTSQGSVRVFAENHTGPRISFLRPTSGQAYGGQMTIQLGVRDPDGVATTTVRLDNNVVVTSTRTSLSYLVNTRTLTEGNHTLDISSVDRVGSMSQVTRSFLVNNQLPAVHITSPSDGATVRDMASFTITATAAGTFDIGFEGQSSQTSPFTAPIDTTMYLNGPRIMTATVTDHTVVDDGNSPSHSAYDQLLITVNNMGGHGTPSLHINTPVAGNYVYLTTTINATVIMPGDVVDHVDFYVDGEKVFTKAGVPYTLDWDFRNYSGMTSIEIRAYGQRGSFASDMVQCPVMPPARFSAQRDYWNVQATKHSAGDLNGDGVEDLVACGGYMTVQLSAGMPQTPHYLQAATGCARARIMDFNGDGRPDVFGSAALGPGQPGSAFVVFEQQSDGTFVLNPTLTFPAGLTVRDFSLADVNGDGQLDIVGAAAIGAMFVMLRTSVGYSAAQIYGIANSSTYALADLDGDGDLDFVSQGVDVVAYLNDGNGAFAPRPGFRGGSTTESAVAAGDVDGDGTVDIVEVNGTSLYVARGNAALPGDYSVVTTLQLPNAANSSVNVRQAVVVADFDRDGAAEIVVNSGGYIDLVRNGAGLECLMGRGATPQTGIEMITADFDNDGSLDIFVSTGAQGSFIYGRRDGSLDAPTCVVGGYHGVAAGDITGDGVADVVTARSLQAQVYTVSGTSLSFDRTWPLNVYLPSQVAVGSFNGAGVDVAVSGEDSRPGGFPVVSVLTQGSGYQESVIDVGDARDRAPIDMVIGDADGDGQNDLVCLSAGGYFSTINPFTGSSTITAIGQGASGIALADLDGSGQVEVLIVNNQGSVGLYDIPNANTRSFVGLRSAIDIAVVQTAPDDGRLDVVINGGPDLAVLRGDPGTILSPLVRYPMGMGAASSGSQMVPADFNGDGLTDLAVVHGVGVMLALANPQGGYFHPDFLACPGTVDLAVGDFDGDGDPDIVCAGDVLALIMNETP